MLTKQQLLQITQFPPEIAKNIWRPPDRQIGDLAGAKYHQKSPKKKYGSKCLKLPNSARNAKIAKNCQKTPKARSRLNLAFKGLKLEI